jgi:FlaA1/EpsC-like NDP-sugar epimerase|tara:strand:- start:2052 stop:3005 length:954 start_codon:yes stop_codon:yes gene_type:complete
MINKKILIIGGTGALGKTLTQRYYKNNNIIILSRDEHKHVNMQRKFPNVTYQIGDIKDKDSILQALNEYKPEIVINTAALKHVPVCEANPYESVKTNIIGHKNLIDCITICNYQIETLMFISTDKACAPINVYGQCKAISERLYIDFANKQNDIKVCLCRYGNVLESTGSVIPFFKELLEGGVSELPITHKDMTRFLLTLEEAVDLIEWSYFTHDSHGKIVIPMIKALKITDIAKSLGRSYGYKDIKLNYTGIRPGEKLHEAMISETESFRTDETDDGYFMITDKIVNDTCWTYSSDTSLMKSEETDKFLINAKVIK